MGASGVKTPGRQLPRFSERRGSIMILSLGFKGIVVETIDWTRPAVILAEWVLSDLTLEGIPVISDDWLCSSRSWNWMVDFMDLFVSIERWSPSSWSETLSQSIAGSDRRLPPRKPALDVLERRGTDGFQTDGLALNAHYVSRQIGGPLLSISPKFSEKSCDFASWETGRKPPCPYLRAGKSIASSWGIDANSRCMRCAEWGFTGCCGRWPEGPPCIWGKTR